MGLFELASILITLAALFGFINHKFVRLPPTIGIMLLSLGGSLALIALGGVGVAFRGEAIAIVSRIDFNETVLHGMLALLLFAGALHLDLSDIRQEWDAIAILALLGTATSTAIVAGLVWLTFTWIGVPLPAVYCILFGALVSPTDPIAVLGIMKRANASRALETQMTGESLFNDGIAVVLFLATLGVVSGAGTPSWSSIAFLLLQEVVGGAAVGFVSGALIYQMLKRVDDY